MNTIKIPLCGQTVADVNVYDLRKALAEYDAKQAEAEKLYDGYTLEQWEYVKEGKFLCEFYDGCVPSSNCSLLLFDRIQDGKFCTRSWAGGWVHCRPAQVYGLRHPCFGKRPEWLKDSDLIICAKYSDGSYSASTLRTAFTFTGWNITQEFIAIPAGGKIE